MEDPMNLTPSHFDGLSAQQLYLFDTVGLLHIPGFLPRDTARGCRSEVLSLPSCAMAGRGDKERFDDLVSQSPALASLACSAAVMQSVEPLISQPLRLIESYALRRERNSIFYLHNGNSEYLSYGFDRVVQRNMSFNHTFHNGNLFCMFVKVLIYLSDVTAPDDGPFCYLEGSHKANWPWFPSDPFVERQALTSANFPSLRHVTVNTGDALIINEALLHGTLPKTTGGERLLMAFSYAPSFVADWREIDKTSADIAKLGHY
jgi:hypothetical protein